jgi:hypothetical protein
MPVVTKADIPNGENIEQRDELQAQLKVALEEWYSVKDVPGKNREEKTPRRKFTTFSVLWVIMSRNMAATGTSEP